MKQGTSDPAPSAADSIPASCPACQSAAILTTSKTPDAESYWRCTTCGEVWNASRLQPQRHRNRGWR
jgi:predicted Zn finger-like uncharacterized protein